MDSDNLLRRVAERAAGQPFFLAASLLAYARAEDLDDHTLAARLGCDLTQLPSLLLCRRPTGEGLVFRKDVEAIAHRFGMEAARLARLIRAADAVVALQRTVAEPSGQLLAAARDRLDLDGEENDVDAPHAHPPEGSP